MKKTVIAVLAATLMFTTSAFAGETFYTGGQIGSWNVFGDTGGQDQNPACVAEVVWQDGSNLQLISDLTTGELYIWFQNNEWNIADFPGDYTFRVNVVSSNGEDVIGGEMTYTLINKNTISIRGIDIDTFIPAFVKMAEIRFIMPGDIQNSYIPLNGSREAVDKLIECLDSYKGDAPKGDKPLNQKPKGQSL